MNRWEHDHAFGQDAKKSGELRTFIVVLLTAATMTLEIAAGLMFGSMALLADGLHMASHAVALAIALFAYIYARRYAYDRRFSFGTGKVNSLAGFAGAILLALFALMMAWESVHRFLNPVEIAFNQALIVAVIGLVVNGVSVFVLGHAEFSEAEHEHSQPGGHGHTHAHDHDHNLRSAYLHVLADTLTSVLAICALLAGKYAGWHWLDPAMGVVGAILVARWSLGLLRATSHILLDRQGSEEVCRAIGEHVAEHGDTLLDLHYWSVAPDRYAVILSVISQDPHAVAYYHDTLPQVGHFVHLTVEVRQDASAGENRSAAR